jgi:hypothetical protein
MDKHRPATEEGEKSNPFALLLTPYFTSSLHLSQIMDLEVRNAALQFECDSLTPAALSKRNQDPASWLPRAPSSHTLESHRNTINCVAFHPVFSSVASGSDDCTIKIWDWEMGELEQTVKGHTRAVLDLDYGGAKGSILLASCSSDLTVKLWDPSEDYKNIRTLPGHDHSVSAVRFIPSSSNLLVSASRDHTLKVWDPSTGFCVKTLRGHAGWVRDVAPSHDGRFLLSTGDDMNGTTMGYLRRGARNSGEHDGARTHKRMLRACAHFLWLFCASRRYGQAAPTRKHRCLHGDRVAGQDYQTLDLAWKLYQDTRRSRQLGTRASFSPRVANTSSQYLTTSRSAAGT